MKYFYTLLKPFLTVFLLLLFNQSFCQVTLTNGDCRDTLAKFDTSRSGFSSPSIFGDIIRDSAFYYDSTTGLWSEAGNHTTALLPNRLVTIISSPLPNPNPPGTITVGFSYKTTSAMADNFTIAIIAVSPGPGGTTNSDVVARTGPQPFSTWGPFTHVTDAGNANNSGDTGHVCLSINSSTITNAPNTFYRVEVAYFETGTTYSSFDNFSIGPLPQGAPLPLPVNFIGILGIRNADNSITVKWDVGDELNVKEYHLERSMNGSSFEVAGIVKAAQKNAYAYIDPNVKTDVVFYRVKSIDIDGSFRFSGIIKVVNKNSYSNTLRVYPSPAQSLVTLQHNRLAANAKLTISTMDGRILKSMAPSFGASNTMIDISTLSSGMYVLRLDDGKGKIETITFVKQ